MTTLKPGVRNTFMSRRRFLRAVPGALAIGMVADRGISVAGGTLAAGAPPFQTQADASGTDWAYTMSLIEACSCPSFCPCYSTLQAVPAAHVAEDGHEHGNGPDLFCEFNMAFHVTDGHFRGTPLEGVRFWIASDEGKRLNDPPLWCEVTFAPSVTEGQRTGILFGMQRAFAPYWGLMPDQAIEEQSWFTVAEDANIEFEIHANTAVATLDNGGAGIMDLADRSGGEPPGINNLAYWAVPRNDGFVIMPNRVEAYRRGSHPFEHTNTTGFVIRTLDFNSNDAV